MFGKNIHKFITSLLTMAIVCTYTAMAAVAAPKPTDGGITITGQVTVNGEPAVSNSTIVSGSTITTGANSSAIISLGSRGKVELLSDSSIRLKFTDNTIVAMLSLGKIRVLNSAGVGATVSTRSGTVVADTGQANSFTVDVGCSDDIKCSQTFVETTSGLVTLRSSSSVKQVAAGANAASGNISQTGCKPCMRPVCDSCLPVAGLGGGAIAAILAAAGAAAFAAIWLSRENDINTDGGVTIVSPIG